MSMQTPRWFRVVGPLGLALFAASCIGNIGGGGDPPFQPMGEGEFACNSPAQDPGPYLIRRLTVDEYLATVQDTLGVDIADLRDALPPEQPQDGFVNAATTQITSLDHVEAWAGLAKEIANRIDPSSLATCAELTDACIQEYLLVVGTKLFRRPPDAVQIGTLTPLFDDVKAEGGTFAEAARRALLAMLQSPWFLYRVEAQLPADGSGYRMLDDYEIASRLSYLLWGTSPDDELYAAAAAGSLRHDDGLRAQVDRMLASDKARVSSLAYLAGWLELDRLGRLPTDLKDDLQAETEALFTQVVWEKGAPLAELLTAPYTSVSQELATHYGFESPQSGVSAYDLPPGRRGLLAHGSVLSSGDVAGSITLRGLFILNKFLCSRVPPPPPGVNNARPEVELGKSQRYYSEQRVSTAPCSNCHAFMDPLAYAFTRFDPYGAPLEVDDKGNPLETHGTFVTSWNEEGKPFADTAEFIDIIASEPRVADCFVLKVAQFALGRSVDEADGCTLYAARDFAGEQASYQGLLRAVALQPSFRMIRPE